MSENKFSVSYEWAFGDLGGRCVRFFRTQDQADVFVGELNKQLSFPGVETINLKVNKGDD